MAGALTANEEAQLSQTIEMFEVITQSQPTDYQSLEILKEAYQKLARSADVVNTSKRIAQAYVQLGQLSSAILEYESILQNNPEDADVQRALADIANKANSFASPAAPQPEAAATDRQGATAFFKKSTGGTMEIAPITELDDGKQQMQKLFVESKLVPSADFEQIWPKVDLREPPREAAEPFLLKVIERQFMPADKAVKLLCEKSRMAYLPIDKYEVDVDFARTIPKEISQRWCILPFDRMSKSLLVATANPFNKSAMQQMEQTCKARVIWYVAMPADLLRLVKKIYR